MNALLHASWLPALGWALLHSLWEGSLVALASALLLRGLQGASPRLRYAVAVTGLLLMAVLPLRHLGPLHQQSTLMVVVQSTARVGHPTLSGDLPTSIPALRTRLAMTVGRALHWVVVAWIVGACLSLLRLAGGWAWLQRLRWRKAELAPDGLQRQLLDLCRRAGLKRAITLLRCEGLAGPSVVGFLRPAILVPAGWFLNLPPNHVEALLAHELAHVLRHDYAVNLMQSLVEVLLFYHPGVWWLSRRIRAERELACDTFAVGLLGDTLPLAEALTHLERRGLGRDSLAPAPAAHGGSLMERITHLLLPPRRTSSAPAFGAMAVMALLLATGLHLAAQTPDPTPKLPPAIPQGPNYSDGRGGIDSEGTVLYIEARNEKDAEGKSIPYTQVLDIKANQVPLNQIWASIDVAIKADRTNPLGRKWARREEALPGPRVNMDLTGAKPHEVIAILNRLAQMYGVAPYEVPDPGEPGPFKVMAYTLKNGKVVLNFHARQVSLAFLDTLLASARNLPAGTGSAFDRESDKASGPKVDAIIEGVTYPELEARIRKLQAEAK